MPHLLLALAPLAITSTLLGAAPVAHAEADGGTHAWVTPGTPLQQTNTVWVRQEGTESSVPIVITTTIKVGTKTIATLPEVTSPAVTIFETVPVAISVPTKVLTAAKREAARARITNATVTFKTRSIDDGVSDGVAGGGSETIAMPVQPGVRVGTMRTAGITFKTGNWLQVADPKGGRAKFAPVAAGKGCFTVVFSYVDASSSKLSVSARLRAQLGNAKLLKRGSSPLPYVIGALEGGVPRLVNGEANNAPPIVRAVGAVRHGGHTKYLNLEARPDASCKASKASTNAAATALERVIVTARPAS